MLDTKEIKIGDLDERILIQSYTEAANTQGEQVKTWSAGTEVWAKVEHPMSGNDEEYDDALKTAFRRVQFTVRAEVTVDETNRIEYPVSSGDYHDIQIVQRLGRNGYKIITAELRQ
jgi:SPP1 family predicted phage head-tail adaptor